MNPSKILAYPDNLMSAKEFAYIIGKCDLQATVIASSYEIKDVFSLLDKVDYIHLYDTRQNKNTGGKSVINKNTSSKAISWIKTNIVNPLLTPLTIAKFYSRYRLLRNLVGDSYRVALIASDRSYADGFTMPFYYFCKKAKIQMVIPSMATFANKEVMLKARIGRKDVFSASWIDKLLSTKHVERFCDVDLTYYPFHIICTLRLFGVLSKNPWVMGANNAAVLCLNNSKAKCEFISSGVNEGNISVTGSYKIDDFVVSNESISSIGFALPQMYEHNLLPWDQHIKIIEEVLFGLKTCKKKIVLFLHPKMNRESYSYLESKYDCSISTQRTDVGIKLVDLFIATFSTTVFTATVYGIPTLVIDCFEAKYKMFDDYTSISVFDDIARLLVEAQRLISDKNSYNAIKQKVLIDSKIIEQNPGLGMRRLKKLIENEIQR